MSYLESLFTRIEIEIVSPTKSDIQKWLAGPKRKPSSYSNVATILQEPFALRDEIESIPGTFEDAPELRALRSDVDSMEIKDQTTITIYEKKLGIAEKAEEQEVMKQEAVRAEEEYRRFILNEWGTAETVEEERQLRRTLKRELPFSLRSAKGWNTRRGKEAFRSIFT